ncbi:MAG: helix-turn-helix domain-containing protein [Methanomethylovorans sp.]|uniref:TrmB family transcriptional regulator n=1 Tax=Methanomethylovorans sp. TaxID=2758717 RepID=UPI00345F0C38
MRNNVFCESIIMNTLIKSLQQLGLTVYEAKVLIALTRYGSGTVADIHALSGIPRSAVYGVLTKLKEKGIIDTQSTKPMRYKAIAPDQIIDRLKANYEKAVEISLEQLEKIYNAPDIPEDDDAVWNISGVKNVTDKIVQMLESAKEEIVLASTYPSLDMAMDVYPIMEIIMQKLQEKIDEGVKVRITINKKQAISKKFQGAEVRVYPGEVSDNLLRGGILVIDNNELLIITIKNETIPMNLAATWYNGKEQISIFRHFIEMEWQVCKPIGSHNNGI